MSRNKYVKIVIAADGTCSVDAVNFTGPVCQAVTKEITEVLGGRISRNHLKPEARIADRNRAGEREASR